MIPTIRFMQSSDINAVFKLIQELAEYEREPQEVFTTPDSMFRDGFSNENPFYKGIVAENEKGEIVGTAIFFHSYSTWKGRALYLDDLIVTESLRGQGIGKLLFDGVVQYAKSISAQRLVWQVLDWNEPAIKFYKKIQAQFLPEWLTCRLTAEGLEGYRF